jgi:integrase
MERLERVKDIFVFCCYTGLAHIDVEKLTPDNIVVGMDGKKWIYTFREKTDNKSNIPLLLLLLPLPSPILEKYRHHSLCINTNRLLPVITNIKINAYLKEIANVCGIKKNFTFHMARHTFATTITLTNGVPIETVSNMLGHSKITTTQIYAKVLENKVSEDMERLEKKLRVK